MLKFIVNGQRLNRVDYFRPVEKSVNYLTAEFLFSDDWDALDKKAICKASGSDEEYDAHIEDNSCLIPWEVISEEGSFDICLKGTGEDNIITTSIVTIDIDDTLTGGTESNPPSETEVEWMRRCVTEMKSKIGELEIHIDESYLIVTVNEDMTQASHSASEIYEHIQKGGNAVLSFMDVIQMNYVGYDDQAIFSASLVFGGSCQSIAVMINEDRSLVFSDVALVSRDDLSNAIPTALPNPKELIINGTSYNGSRSVSINTGEIPTTLPNPKALTINGTSYDGSKAVEIDIPSGTDGTDGKDGEDGADGITPHIGANGNWWLGDTDTGVKASAGSGGGPGYAVQIDNITVETEGLTEIELAIDLTECYEARIFTYIPATGLGSNYSYYVVTGDGVYQNSLCSLSALSSNSSGGIMHYKAITETLGEVEFAAGLPGGKIDETEKIGGQANLQAAKAPRSVNSGTRLVSGNAASFAFPLNTRIMSFAWTK